MKILQKIRILYLLPVATLLFFIMAPLTYASTLANVTASGNTVSLVTDSSDSAYCLSATGGGGYYLLSLRQFGVGTFQGTPVLNTGAGQTLSITLGNGNYYQTRIDCTDGPSHTSVEDAKLLGTTNQANTEFTLPVVTTVANPVISPNGGSFSATHSVTISTSTSGASIRYTTDGSTPTSSHGLVYSSAISISANTTLKAIGYKNTYTDSSVVTASFLIGTQYHYGGTMNGHDVHTIAENSLTKPIGGLAKSKLPLILGILAGLTALGFLIYWTMSHVTGAPVGFKKTVYLDGIHTEKFSDGSERTEVDM